jgi:NAD(P)-dependent dehydrogenase (short-subunit alcohol dehydrogenase family)
MRGAPGVVDAGVRLDRFNEMEGFMKTILITGAGSGIGLATALELARSGHRVLATMLGPDETPELGAVAAREGLPIQISKLDVTSDASVFECFESIEERIDVLVNNAGIDARGSIEELPLSAFWTVMDTNYLGAVRCMKAVLPQMRRARSGCIINISSLAGRAAHSPLGAYSASKFALEAISETLAGEVKPFDIRVAIVEPGVQDTGLAQRLAEPGASVYRQVQRYANLFRAALVKPVSPGTTALVVRAIVESGTWQLRHPAGPEAAPFMQWRASLTDEQWIDWNAQDDEEWYRQVHRDFGLDARPTD